MTLSFTPLPCSKISYSLMSYSIKSGFDNLAQPSLNHSCSLILPSPLSRALSEAHSSFRVSKSHNQGCICLSLENVCLGGHILFALSAILTPPLSPIHPSRSSSKSREKNKISTFTQILRSRRDFYNDGGQNETNPAISF